LILNPGADSDKSPPSFEFPIAGTELHEWCRVAEVPWIFSLGFLLEFEIQNVIMQPSFDAIRLQIRGASAENELKRPFAII
jgi:hypothetical protein